MDQICDKNLCSGCSACKSICPRDAIKMEYDKKGFLVPVIDYDKCINCGMCKEVCQVNKKMNKFSQIKIYACKNKNENVRQTSSSGGIFEEFSKSIIAKNGYVYGAAFDENLEVEHKRIEDINGLEEIKKSKYVQSNMKDVIKDVKKALNEGKAVLFSGTPCQVQAVNILTRLVNDNLYTVDLVCHGVPSPQIFDKYKKYLEKEFNSKIIDVNFRWKDEASTQNIKIKFENGKEYISNYRKGDIFYNLFLRDLVLRDVCYSCKFRDLDRVSDISIADFWGLDKGNYKDFYDGRGVSLVLVNTQKGLELFDSIKENMEYIEIEDKDFVKYNSFSEMKEPTLRKEFWDDYEKEGFENIDFKKYIF